MSEPAPAPAPTPSPAPAPAPAAAAPSPAPEPQVASRPDFLPEAYWDDQAHAIKTDDFGKHYTETASAAQKWSERAAAIPAKPEDYKIELKLPADVKLPDGVKFDPSKDPRTPHFLKAAHALGLSNTEVNQLVALDAQMMLSEHAAETARVAEETKKLGEKATDRIAAVKSWAKALPDLSEDERAEIYATASTAAGVTVLEKLMAKITGSIPGHQPSPEPRPGPKSVAERMYPNLPSGLPPASARSA